MTIAIENPELQKKLGQSEFKVSEMTDTVAQELMKYQKEFKAMSPEDIVRQQANAVQNLMKDVNYILGIMRIQGAKTGDSAVKALFGMDSKDMGTMLSNQGDKGSDFAGAFIKDKMEGVRAILDQANESANKIKESQQEQNKQTTTQSNNKKEVVFRHVSDSAMGAYQRQLQSNPQFWADLMKSDERSYTP